MVIVIVNIELKNGSEQKFTEIFSAYREIVLRENGCISYNLSKEINLKSPNFILLEKWENRSLLDIHLSSTNLKNYVNETQSFIIKKEIEVFEVAK
ncbi:MAG: antibiotic biosynthesis monooxygenase [Candidatus Delongbacteria bacterium]|nr:antibiotic biosynthesis monooxygenase [Candidatus Delongbacteria bacterium]MBN2834680.1 antibiotic biosynthesis monooxygenase [Candidatus Delongbacteria bacterium]